MRKYISISLLLLLACGLRAQDHLKNLRNKTSGQIANASNGTFMDSTFFKSRIGTNVRDLSAAVEERALTPYDFASLQAAKDTASARLRPLVIPWNYTASTLTFKAADSALVLICYGTVNITASDTIPAGAQIVMRRSGRFNLSGAVTTFLIASEFLGKRSRHFYGAGAGYVKFGDGAVDAIFPEWWGAKNDSTGNWGIAFQNAVNSVPRRHGTIDLNGQGKGYIINTKVVFPKGNVNPREVHIEGNGATIYSSMSDTVFVIRNMSVFSGGASLPRHSIKNVWFKRIDLDEDGDIGSAEAGGVAVCINNSVDQTVEYNNFQDYAIGVLLYNSYQGGATIDSAGWNEVHSISHNRFTACDTAIFLKRQYPASGTGHTGHESFATTRIEHNAIALGGAASRVGSASKNVVGIAISKHARAYRCSFEQNYIGTTANSTAFYCDGRLDGSMGHFGLENFGSAQARSYFFDFGSNATNMGSKFFVGYEGLPGLRSFIRSATSKPLPQIETWIKGDGSGEARGITTVYKDTASTYLWSLLRSSELDGFVASGATNDSDYTFISKVSTGRQITVNLQRSKPLQFLDFDGKVQPVRLIDIGNNRSTVNDSTVIDVRNTTHLLVGDANGADDSLTAFKGGTVGQTLTVNFVSDKTLVSNLIGGTGSGRLFLVDNRTALFPSGTKSVFKCESETGGLFWREIDRFSPMVAATWNPGNLAAGATDSTTFFYWGARVGDPVLVGLSTITSTTANFDLKAHVISDDVIRVFVTNRGGGAYDIPSGTLRYKVIK